MKLPCFLLSILLLGFCSRATAQSEQDLLPFPLGPLGGKAYQEKGTSLLRITEVTPGGRAAAAGMKVGDFIYGVNNERLPLVGPVHVDGWRGAVSELGYAIERSESTSGALSLQILRAGTGILSLNLTLPLKTAWRPSYPVGDVRMREYFDKVCADLHSQTTASADGNFAYETGFFGIILLAHPDWNQTTAPRPYRNSINKLKDRCVAHLAGRILEPVENTLDCADTGYENWDITASAMFLGEYRRKTGDATVDAAVQRSAAMIANRIQNYPQLDNAGVMQQKLGRMGHCGVVGDYPHIGLTGLNIMNAHAMLAMGMLKGAGADFTQASGGSGMTINQKYLLNWAWLKSCTNTAGANEDGNIGYGGIQTDSYDSAARTPGSAAGYEIYRAAGGTAATADDLDKLSRMKAYTPRNWQRQQHAHAYTLGGVAFSHMLLPFVSDREQRYFLENERFFFTLTRQTDGELLYFPGRALSSGDNEDRTRYIMPGLAWAVTSGNLPSFPLPATGTSRIFVRMNSPRNDWPQLAARRAKVVGLTQNLDLDATDSQGNVLPAANYTAAWSQVSGATVNTTSINTVDTTFFFPSAGAYRLRLRVTAGSYLATEDYDFEVSTSVTPPDTTATITQQPLSRYFVPGGSAALTIAVTGGGPFVYQWKLDGEEVGTPSASPVLNLTNLSTAAAGLYQCTIWHPAGQVTTSACELCLAGTVAPIAGGLKREVWNNLGGVTVAKLTGSARYPRCPDVTGMVLEAEAPRDSGDLYGQRLSGWVVPPVTGDYTFYLATDDAGELWLSTDDTTANKQKIAQITPFTTYRNYSAGPSAPIALTAGKRYYIEALQVDGGGASDHLSVAWRKPGDPVPATGSAPIPGTYLQGEAFTAAPAFEDIVSWWTMDEGAGTAALDSMSTANDGALTGPAWTAGRRGGALLFDGTDKIQCSNNGALGGLTAFTVAAWVKVNAGNTEEGVIVQQRMAAGTVGNGQYQLLVNAAGKVRFFCYGDNLDQFNFSSTASINDGQWHHVAGIRDSVGGGRIYVDGVLNGSVTGTTLRTLRTATTIAIGADTRDGGTFFRGSIDDVRIYACALTAAQISTLVTPPGQWTASPWTGDASAGILPGTAWAYHFGSAATATIAGQTVTGLATASPSVAGKFAITGVGEVYNTDANNLTSPAGTGSAVVARDFIYGGNPATLTLQGLTAGRSYVATILSVGWEAAGRQSTFSSGGHVQLIDQDQYGDNNGIRVDYTFTAEAATRVITITPSTANTFHLYGLALRQGFIVSNNCDAGTGSLRQALADAALSPGADTITFDPSLNGRQIDLLTSLTVSDTGGVTVNAGSLSAGLTLSGRGANRLFQVTAGSTLTLDRLKLTNGRAGGAFPGSYGGGIFSQGDLTLTGCSLSNCSALTAGGAIAHLGTGTASLDSCSVYNNSAAYGGGVQNEGTFIAHTSTFTGNSATQAGGAISAPFNKTVLIRRSTVSGNTAGVSGGGMDGTNILIEDIIAAGNTAPAGPNINGTPAAAGGVNITSGNPLLTALGDYGGPTLTMLPMPGSPAINTAGGGSASTLDQRGFARGAMPDIGAAEYLGRSDLARYWTGDWDGDGSPNGAELALLTNPHVADRGGPLHPRMDRVGDGRLFVGFGYNPALAGQIRWVLQTSAELNVWSTAYYWDGSSHFFGGRTGGLTGSLFTIIEGPAPPPRRYYRFTAELLP